MKLKLQLPPDPEAPKYLLFAASTYSSSIRAFK